MGIDYGLGRTNIDHATGIRFGVIPVHDVSFWWDSAEPVYPDPCCPKCGDEAQGITGAEQDFAELNDDWEESQPEDGPRIDPPELQPLMRGSCADYGCAKCGVYFGADDMESEPISHRYDSEGYRADTSGDMVDIFVTLSPFYTFAPFCSPCAPGAVYLRDGDRDGDARGYCFGHDWFDGGVAPYPVFLVADDSEVYPAGLSF